MSPKKKSSFFPWFVAGIFVLLLCASLYLDSKDKTEKTKIRIYSMSKDDIKAFELDNKTTGETVAFERYGMDWSMVRPKSYEIEKTDVEKAVTHIAALMIDRKIENAGVLSDYGLEKPGFAVNFTLKSGKQLSLLIGDKNPTGNYYYVKDKERKELFVAYSYSVENFMKSSAEFRKKSLFELDPEKISKTVFRSEVREFSLVKIENKDWEIKPYGFKGNNEEIKNTIQKMLSLKAKSIIADSAADLKKYGLEKPKLTLTAESVDNKTVVMLIGNKHLNKDEDYAKLENSPVIYTIDGAFMPALDKTYNYFRESKLFYLSGSDVDEMEIIKNKSKIVIKKNKKGLFEVAEPARALEAKRSETLCNDLLRTLSTLRAQTFADDSGQKYEKYGLREPKTIITVYELRNNEKIAKEKLFIGDAVKKIYYAKTGAGDSVYTIGSEVINAIDKIEKAVEVKQ